MIKNIIFDFGDVFINLDKKAPEYALGKVGVRVTDHEIFELHNRYEKGLVTTEHLIETYLSTFPSLNEISFKLAWNSIILDFPENRLNWLLNLAKTGEYRLFLLSNTNDLHIEQVIKNMGAINYIKFQSCFEKFYLSQHMKMRKPDLEIYDHVLTENNLVARETLFIDDTILNTLAASSLNINTWHLQPGIEDVTELFTIKKDLF